MDQQQFYEYNKYRTPCSWVLAQDHFQAMKPGSDKKNVSMLAQGQFQEKNLCPCCFNVIEKVPIPICISLYQLSRFGSGFSLFYSFMKVSILSLMILMINSSIILLYHAIDQNFNSENNQYINFTVMFSTAYLDMQGNSFQLVSGISFLSQLVLLILFRRKQFIQYKYIYESKSKNQSYYSLILYNLPEGNDNNQQKIKNYIEKTYDQAKVFSVTLLLSTIQLKPIEKEIDFYIKQWKNFLQSSAKTNQQMHTILKVIKLKTQQLKKKKKMIKCNERVYFNGTAIVTLHQRKQRQMILNNPITHNYDELEEFFENIDMKKQITIDSIGNPNEILWENIHYTEDERSAFQGFGNLLILALLASFYFLYFIIQFMFHLLKNHSGQSGQQIFDNYSMIPSIICMLLVQVLNKFVLCPFVHKVCQNQKHRSETQNMISFANKLTISYFFTTAMMVLFIEGFIYHNVIDHFGIVQEETLMFLVNTIFLPTVYLINPWYLINRLKLYINRDRKSLSQQEANHLLAYPEYNIGKRYADVIKTIWFTFMYSDLIPIGTIFSFICLSLYYWIDKYNLLRRSSVNNFISVEISKSMLVLFELTLVIKPIANIYFIYQVKKYFCYFQLALAIIGLLYVITPITTILQKVLNSNEKNQQQLNIPIENAINKFKTLYELEHPLYFTTKQKMNFINKNLQMNAKIKNYKNLGEIDSKTQTLQTKNCASTKQQDYEDKQKQTERHILPQ